MLLLLAGAVQAGEGVRVTDAWARATAPGQKVAGIYLNIVSDRDARLAAVESSLAGQAELHQMRMDSGTMRMRPVEAIDLPAGQIVTLRPGDYHVMLFDLKRPLKPGDEVPLRLTVTDAAGKKQVVAATARVRNLDGSEPHRDH
jgi:copper(I)-binding protein